VVACVCARVEELRGDARRGHGVNSIVRTASAPAPAPASLRLLRLLRRCDIPLLHHRPTVRITPFGAFLPLPPSLSGPLEPPLTSERGPRPQKEPRRARTKRPPVMTRGPPVSLVPPLRPASPTGIAQHRSAQSDHVMHRRRVGICALRVDQSRQARGLGEATPKGAAVGDTETAPEPSRKTARTPGVAPSATSGGAGSLGGRRVRCSLFVRPEFVLCTPTRRVVVAGAPARTPLFCTAQPFQTPLEPTLDDDKQSEPSLSGLAMDFLWRPSALLVQRAALVSAPS
jgi:hypothetical protein